MVVAGPKMKAIGLNFFIFNHNILLRGTKRDVGNDGTKVEFAPDARFDASQTPFRGLLRGVDSTLQEQAHQGTIAPWLQKKGLS